jgi:hypothetical protein
MASKNLGFGPQVCPPPPGGKGIGSPAPGPIHSQYEQTSPLAQLAPHCSHLPSLQVTYKNEVSHCKHFGSDASCVGPSGLRVLLTCLVLVFAQALTPGVEQEVSTVVSIPELHGLSVTAASATENVAARASKLIALNCIVD